MGVTIHYSGRARGFDGITSVLETAQLFAAQRGWMFAMYDDPFGVMDDRDHEDPGYLEHEGPYRGIVLRPHPRSEPVRLQFDVHNELFPALTRTHYAPYQTHADVVALLRAIEPFMEQLSVDDEAGLWEGGDEAAARARFGEDVRVAEEDRDEVAQWEEAFHNHGGVPDLADDPEEDEAGWRLD